MSLFRRKGNRTYGYGSDSIKEQGAICEDMSFTAAESYKMLRTKLDLVLPEMIESVEGEPDTGGKEHFCKVIGITSALQGEGKSTTSINLAYTIAEAGHSVCLLEADMRLPNIHHRLALKSSPGLSNLLSGQTKNFGSIQKYTSHTGVQFYVLPAGDIPPTPSELLGSSNMKIVMETLKKSMEYIIVDLPPVTVVTDALVVSKYLDGVLMVVRENFCDRVSLQDAVDQFALTDTKMLGVVFNCSDGPSGGNAYHYRKRRSYYKSYSERNQITKRKKQK